MSLITVLKNVVLENGVKFQREPTIDSGTRALFDFRSTWAGAGQAVAANTNLKDLTYNNLVAVNAAALTFAGNGFYFNNAVTVTNRINIPQAACPQYADTDWLLQFWFNPEEYAAASNLNNQLLNISNNTAWNYNVAMCTIILNLTSDLKVPSDIRFGVRGKLVTLNSAEAIAKFTGASSRAPLLISVHYKYGATTDLIEVYLDGVLFGSLNTAPWTTAITAATTRCLNASSAYPKCVKSKYYRYRLDDLTLTDRTAAELIALEYAQCKDVFT